MMASSSSQGIGRVRRRVLVVVAILALCVVATGSAGATTRTDWALQRLAWPATNGVQKPTLIDVSCSAAHACMVVGNYLSKSDRDDSFADRWNGTTWSLVSMPSPKGAVVSSLFSISCLTPTECTAVGYSPDPGPGTLAERWNGTKWVVEATPNPTEGSSDTFVSVDCPSANFCMATGYGRLKSGRWPTFSESWNGHKWSLVSLPEPQGALRGIVSALWCHSASSCIAIGNYSAGQIGDLRFTSLSKWNGHTWSTQVFKAGLGDYIEDLSCSSTVACTAVGYTAGDHPAVVLRWTGSTWSLQHVADASSKVTGISCRSTSACTAAGAASHRVWAESWNGAIWAGSLTPKLPGEIEYNVKVSCGSASSCMAIGTWTKNSPTSGTIWGSFAEHS